MVAEGDTLPAVFRHACLIYNPQAGGLSKQPSRFADAVAAVRECCPGLKLVETEDPRTAGRQAREAAEGGAELVAVAGGDGTFNEVLDGMAGSDVPVALLPGGTANVLAMETGLGGDLLGAARALPALVATRCPLGLLEQPGLPPRHFAMMAGLGLDARIVRQIKPAAKRRLGKLAYWIGGFSQLGRRLEEFDVALDGARRRCSFALVSQVRNYGGDLTIARQANLLEPGFAVVLFEGASSLPYLKYFSGVLLDRLEGMQGVQVARAACVELLEPADIQIDGEYGGLGPARLSGAPAGVTLMLPRAFVERGGR
jgi:diacylglycerol kinase family enzyme